MLFTEKQKMPIMHPFGVKYSKSHVYAKNLKIGEQTFLNTRKIIFLVIAISIIRI